MDIIDYIEKYNNCVDNLDENQTCDNCFYKDLATHEFPCNECYNSILALPVNPTKFKNK